MNHITGKHVFGVLRRVRLKPRLNWPWPVQLQKLSCLSWWCSPRVCLVLLHSMKSTSIWSVYFLFYLQYIKPITILQIYRNSVAESHFFFFFFFFAMTDTCISAFLNVIDLTTGTVRQNGAIKCIYFPTQIGSLRLGLITFAIVCC